MPELLIRVAQESERAALESLQMRASLAWEEYRDALLAHPEAVQLPPDRISAGHVFVAQDGADILGFCVVLPREDGDAEIDGCFVDPACWRGGVGSRLVQHARRIAAGRGAALLHVVATPRGQRFYESCGFEPTGDTPTRFGPALAMRSDIRR